MSLFLLVWNELNRNEMNWIEMKWIESKWIELIFDSIDVNLTNEFRRNNAALVIQRIIRGFLAKKLAKQRKQLFVDK